MEIDVLRPPHKYAGRTVHITKGSLRGNIIRVEDWFCNIVRRPWRECLGNYAVMQYAARSKGDKIPNDDNVVYGKIGFYGYVLHDSEIELTVADPDPEC